MYRPHQPYGMNQPQPYGMNQPQTYGMNQPQPYEVTQPQPFGMAPGQQMGPGGLPNQGIPSNIHPGLQMPQVGMNNNLQHNLNNDNDLKLFD